MIDIKVLKENIVAYAGGDSAQIKRYVGYIDSINRKDKNGKDLSFGITIEDFVKLYIKYANVGVTVDGINAVVTGYNKVFITWNGYKNKVLSVYPESEFDTQLVRKGDTITFAKESGSVVYSHQIADPFSSNFGIIGAYCVIKNKRGEVLETLGLDDFKNMKDQAMMTSTWTKWESEFWLKSVIKRACKRHFNDVVEEIEKIDNEDYQIEPKEKWQPSTDRGINEQQKMFLDSMFRIKEKVTDDEKDSYLFDNFGFDYRHMNEQQAFEVLNEWQAETKESEKEEGGR